MKTPQGQTISLPDGHGRKIKAGHGAAMGLEGDRPTMDSPGRGPMPDRHITTKAGEVRANDRTAGVGVRPGGTLNR